MVRSVVSYGCLLLFAALTGAAPAPEKEDKERRDPVLELRQKLASPVRFSGWEKDERMSLRDGLEQLGELYDLRFIVNEAAFRAEKLEQVLETAVVAKEHLPKMTNVRLETVLRAALSRVPVPSGATYIIRPDHIEITTVQALRKEVLGDSDRPLLPLVHAHFDRSLLHLALQELAERTGFNVVLDPRAGDKAKTAVSAKFNNVPLDTAVRLLANMAGLKPVQIDNVLYVTTADNAQTLQKEHEKRTLERSGDEKPGDGASRMSRAN